MKIVWYQFIGAVTFTAIGAGINLLTHWPSTDIPAVLFGWLCAITGMLVGGEYCIWREFGEL